MKISLAYFKKARAKINLFLAMAIGIALLAFTLFYAGTREKAGPVTDKTGAARANTDEPWYAGAAFLFWTFSRLCSGNIGE